MCSTDRGGRRVTGHPHSSRGPAHEVRVGEWVLSINEAFTAGGAVIARVSAVVDGCEPISSDISLTSRQDRRRFLRGLARHAPNAAVPQELALIAAEDALRARIDTAINGVDLSLIADDVDPWPCHVDGAALVREIARLFERYVYLPPGAATAIALYVIFTWCIDLFDIAPILALVSPTRRAGKTTCLEVLAAVISKPMPMANTSASAMFRTIDEADASLIVDEADTWLKPGRSDSLVGLMNAGHRRRTAFVLRSVPGPRGPETKRFSVFGAKIIASIRGLPSTLQDRSIQIHMIRRGPADEIEQLRYDQLEYQGLRLKSKIARWLSEHIEDVEGADPQPLDGLHDRLQQSWFPLFSIAEAAGPDCLSAARDAALLLLDAVEPDEPDQGVVLLRDILRVFRRSCVDFIPTHELLRLLCSIPESTWASSFGGQGGPHALARHLKPFGISPVQPARGAPRGYRRVDVVPVCERYIDEGRFGSADEDEVGASGASGASDEGDRPWLRDDDTDVR